MINLSNDDIDLKLNKLIKIGEVSSVNYEKGTADVSFGQDDAMINTDLQVLQRNTFKNKDYAMPDVGEDVVCLFLPNGLENGFVLGSVYAGNVELPESSGDKRTIKFSDDTVISYDRNNNKLTIVIGDTNIIADKTSVNVKTSGQLIGEASNATVTASAITLNGDVTINGNVIATGDVVGMGVSLKNHTHTGNAGNPTSAPI